jgi:hypothetical protein
MSLQVITLTNSPNQSYTVNLTVDGSPLTLNITINYNEMAGYWILAIFNANSQLLIDSVPMLTGAYPAGNLLQQQKYLNIGSWYLVNVSNLQVETSGNLGYGEGGYGQGGYGGEQGQGGTDYPNATNLGTDFQLWVDDTPEV